MSLTPAQVRLAMIPLIRRLVRGGRSVASFSGIAPDLGQIVITTPDGRALSIELPVTLAVLVPLEAYVADAESRIRTVLRPYEGEVGRGFNPSRGTLDIAEPGSVAGEGAV